MKVRRLPVDPGPAGWNALLPKAPTAVPLEERTAADWLVVGAGFAGLAAARRLSQLCPEDRILILEASRVGAGPAGRNSGFMIDLPHDLASENYGGALESDVAQTAENRRAIDFAEAMAREFGLSQEAFNRSGKVNGAATAKGNACNRAFARHLQAMHEAHQILDAQEMKALTGTDYYTSGLFTPGCAMIQPAMFVRGVAAGLTSNRVQLFEHSPVVALDQIGSGWVAQTPKGQVTAPRVILAVNGHLESFGHMTGRLMHVFTYASMTRELTPEEVTLLGGEFVWGITPADPLGTTVRRISGPGGNRLLIRNRFTYDPSLAVPDNRIVRVGRDHDRAFRARFPMLGDVAMEFRWGGRLCLSYNNVQVVRELEPGLWSACCQNGLGTAKGTLAGMTAAEAATGQAQHAPLLSEPLPQKLPPAPLARVGASVRLRLGEMRAGREL